MASTDAEIRKQCATVGGTDDDIPHQTMLRFGHVASGEAAVAGLNEALLTALAEIPH